jgi:hypothetical protein
MSRYLVLRQPACILGPLDAGQIALHVRCLDNSAAYYKERKLFVFFFFLKLFCVGKEQRDVLTLFV